MRRIGQHSRYRRNPTGIEDLALLGAGAGLVALGLNKWAGQTVSLGGIHFTLPGKKQAPVPTTMPPTEQQPPVFVYSPPLPVPVPSPAPQPVPQPAPVPNPVPAPAPQPAPQPPYVPSFAFTLDKTTYASQDTVSGQATDRNGAPVNQVAVFLDNPYPSSTLIGQGGIGSDGRFAFPFDFRGIPNGSHALYLSAFSNRAHAWSNWYSPSLDVATTVTVDNTPQLTISTLHPSISVIKGETIQIGGLAYDLRSPPGVQQIDVYLDGTAFPTYLLGTAQYGVGTPAEAAARQDGRFANVGWLFGLDTSNLSLGNHTVYIYALDTFVGAWSRDFQPPLAITVTVNAPPPPATTPEDILMSNFRALYGRDPTQREWDYWLPQVRIWLAVSMRQFGNTDKGIENILFFLRIGPQVVPSTNQWAPYITS